MDSDKWINQMLKDIKPEKQETENPTVQLSESDMNRLADIMIKKMSDSDDGEKSKDISTSKSDNEKPDNIDESGETSLD